ncbi:transketolase [Desulfobacterota bacterium AH_259_B03_O07]|nr:transketolase [Desulfobacterota bacterium AH_259_B03_O07]
MVSQISDEQLAFLEDKANQIREDIIKMLLEAGSGHSAGSLGTADIFTALYFHVMKHDPKNPDWEDRDRFVLSNAHICPVLYATLAHAGYYPREEMMTLRKFGSRLQGHPHRGILPGLEASGGPLGHGISIAIGMTLADKIDGKRRRVYCMLGDGEQDEGQVWEALMFAGKNKLNNLAVVVDRNNIQIDGFTEDIMPMEPLNEKYRSFGWHILEVDGHNIRSIVDAFDEAKAVYEKPTMVIAHTIPGKGVDFMEFKPEWHGKPPNKEEAEKALAELEQIKSLGGKITCEHH